ncbi:NAD(P)-dependent oxidoreductase [Bradyrhizobium sp. STM 3557]|uniref:NAD(P)-dependent oxidoreductase n=1 Tax=Bradyrhizobium sp. STM 3557 TaxID=578920 RepID=UPI00388FA047
MDRTVGVVGLGIMGGAVARNLRERGWRVLGVDIDADRREALAADGVEIAPDAGSLAHEVPIILTSLPSPKALQSVAAELAASGAPKRFVAELSTFTVDEKLAFAAMMEGAGHVALDCPLSGTGAQAAIGDLVVYASGDRAAVDACMPLFADFAKKTAFLGAFGNGSRMKYVANLLVAIHNVASAEAMVLAIKSGLDPRDVVEVIAPGAGGSRIFELRAPMMARDDYQPATMRVSTWDKDMHVIDEFAHSLGVWTPCFDASKPVYDEALRMGLGELDTAAVCKVIAAQSGLHRSDTN